MKFTPSRMLPIAALFVLTTTAQAQGPGGGGFQIPPAMQAKFKAWQHWRDSHKNVTSLQRTLGALGDMERDPRTKLTKPQAQKALAVIKKWQSKPALTDAQALQVNKQLTAPLSLAQIKKIAMASQGRRGGFGGGGGGRGPGGGGGGRPGGGFGGGRPGGGGGRPPMDPNAFPAPKDYNPLNANTLPFARQRPRAKQRMAQLMAVLAASAK